MDSDDDLDHSIYTFLQGRNVDVEKLKEQRIDSKVIEEMDDKELSKFIPMYGDRVIVRGYIRKGTGTTKTKRKSKGSILASLKQTIKSMRSKKKKKGNGTSDSESDETSNKFIGNKNALKGTRQIKIVPMKKDTDGTYTKIRTKKGGGPRKVPISKSSNKKDIIQLAKRIYFGNTGNSKLGSVNEFTYELQNYENDDMDENITVGDMYQSTGLTLLSFYFVITDIEDIELPKLASPKKIVKKCERNEIEGDCISLVGTKVNKEEIADDQTKKEGEISCTQSVPTDILAEAMLASGVNYDGSLDNIPDFLETDVFADPEGNIVQYSGEDLLDNFMTVSTQNEDTSDRTPPSESSTKIRVRRSNLVDDLISQFKKDIISQDIRFEFVNEIGADVDGVSRDVYSTFWLELFMCSSEGEECRVPALSPRWQAEEWIAIGRILAKGYKDHKVFPLQLAKVSTVVLSFGEEAVRPDLLFETFLKFVSQTDRELLEAALKEDLVGNERDELLDVLERYGCSTNPKKDNMRVIIDKIAHKELIQKPKYAIDNMAVACRDVFLSTFLSVDKLLEMYDDLAPTPRKVLKLLQANPVSNGENNSFRYFQQYIRGQNNVSLKKLLRFMTGSETINVSKIEISFTELEGFSRRPLAHTCGPSLELPSTYSSYPELRMEFDHILSNEKSFEMNIV